MTGGRSKQLEWSQRAVFQLAAQFDYVISRRLASPELVRSRLERTLALLQEHPEIGAAGRRAGTRELSIKDSPLTIVYRVRRARIQILAIVHQRQIVR